jgi:hypothetical protein
LRFTISSRRNNGSKLFDVRRDAIERWQRGTVAAKPASAGFARGVHPSNGTEKRFSVLMRFFAADRFLCCGVGNTGGAVYSSRK